MKIVIVGGHTRNIGKTSVVEGIIRAMPEMNWTAVKITQYGHGVCSADGEVCDCADLDHPFVITAERREDTGTDTSRFLSAGAKRSLWVRTRQGELFTALSAFTDEIRNDEYVIVESNSLRRFITPSLFLQVVDVTNPDLKDSARSFFDLADGYVVPDDRSPQSQAQPLSILLEREIRRRKPLFSLDLTERTIGRALVDFVYSRIGSDSPSYALPGDPANSNADRPGSAESAPSLLASSATPRPY